MFVLNPTETDGFHRHLYEHSPGIPAVWRFRERFHVSRVRQARRSDGKFRRAHFENKSTWKRVKKKRTTIQTRTAFVFAGFRRGIGRRQRRLEPSQQQFGKFAVHRVDQNRTTVTCQVVDGEQKSRAPGRFLRRSYGRYRWLYRGITTEVQR